MRNTMDFEAYSAQVLQVLLTNLDQRSGHLTVASLGERLSRANLEGSWRDFHFKSFLRFVEELQKRGAVRLLQTEKKAWAVAPVDGSTLAPVINHKSYNPLRKAVWAAFVFSSPTGRRFLHRASGSVRLGLKASPSPLDEWVEILPITDEEQKEWALQFAEKQGVSAEKVKETLETEDWHKSFPVALSEHSSFKIRIEWNRCRSLKVSSFVETWAQENTVPVELLFIAPEHDAPAETARRVSSGGRLNEQETRQCILAALSKLTTEQLLSISLPSSALLEAAKSHFSNPRDFH